jgi:phage recombination protein Bet
VSEVAEINTPKPKLLEKMGARFGVDPKNMVGTLKATAFKTKNDISNEQMIALLVVADQYGLNPWTREIYAFPDKQGGIVPVVGVDGWSRIINTHEAFDGMDYEYSDKFVESEEHKSCPEWVRCTIYRKDRAHPISVTEYFDECYRPPFEGTGKNGSYKVNGPWQSHPKRFLRHKTTIQCARLAFGFVGIFDQDEAERIVESEVQGSHRKSTSVTQAVIEEEGIEVDQSQLKQYVEQLREAVFDQDDSRIRELFDEMDNDMKIMVNRDLNSADRSYIREARHGGEDE